MAEKALSVFRRTEKANVIADLALGGATLKHPECPDLFLEVEMD